MNNKNFLLYGHGGCYNHGVEAITSCTISYLRGNFPDCHITLVSHFPEQDKEFGLAPDEFVTRNMAGKNNREIYKEALARITKDTIAIHVGGDNYCYQNWQRYALIHEETKQRGGTSILWGCSIDESVIDAEMLEVLRTHDWILARECITYRTLLSKGLSNVKQVSDIAFGLRPKKIQVPFMDSGSSYIVLNLSPLVCRKNPVALEAFQELIRWISEETEAGIILLPHVLMSVDNDYEVLSKLTCFGQRIFLASDKLSAAEYKYIISKAEVCVAARTHVTIAAYSSCVPTLAVGYSVKAQGIAMDLGMSQYVIDILSDDFGKKLCESFMGLWRERQTVKKSLCNKMDGYIQRSTNLESFFRK